jgi:drug/metabolite transporter (DMT)-like permease
MSKSTLHSLQTFAIVAGCAILFSSKGVFIKCAFALGADPVTVLGLRMAYALPGFIVAGWFAGRGAPPLAGRQWARLALLGFVGYYLSAMMNFAGLRHISVGMERMVLYTYPTLVVIGSALFLKMKVRPLVVAAIVISYAGILTGYAGETRAADGNALTGVGLVFGSAVTYAYFVIASGGLIREIGPMRFTAHAVGMSCLFVIIHFLATHSLAGLAEVPAAVHGYALILAVFGTLIPSFLLGIGLRRAGATRFAIIGTVGPMATVVLAWAVLGEGMNGAQIAGLCLSLSGGLLIALGKS